MVAIGSRGNRIAVSPITVPVESSSDDTRVDFKASRRVARGEAKRDEARCNASGCERLTNICYLEVNVFPTHVHTGIAMKSL